MVCICMIKCDAKLEANKLSFKLQQEATKLLKVIPQ